MAEFKTATVEQQTEKLLRLFRQLPENPSVGSLPDVVLNRDRDLESFAIPNIWRNNPALPGRYGENVSVVLDLVREDCRNEGVDFDDVYFQRRCGTASLRQTSEKLESMSRISKTQGHPDILVLRARFRPNNTLYSSRTAAMPERKFGQRIGKHHVLWRLGLFSVGIMLLTYPQRSRIYCGHYTIDCSADSTNEDSTGFISNLPYLTSDQGRVDLTLFEPGDCIPYNFEAQGAFRLCHYTEG